MRLADFLSLIQIRRITAADYWDLPAEEETFRRVILGPDTGQMIPAGRSGILWTPPRVADHLPESPFEVRFQISQGDFLDVAEDFPVYGRIVHLNKLAVHEDWRRLSPEEAIYFGEREFSEVHEVDWDTTYVDFYRPEVLLELPVEIEAAFREIENFVACAEDDGYFEEVVGAQNFEEVHRYLVRNYLWDPEAEIWKEERRSRYVF